MIPPIDRLDVQAHPDEVLPAIPWRSMLRCIYEQMEGCAVQLKPLREELGRQRRIGAYLDGRRGPGGTDAVKGCPEGSKEVAYHDGGEGGAVPRLIQGRSARGQPVPGRDLGQIGAEAADGLAADPVHVGKGRHGRLQGGVPPGGPTTLPVYLHQGPLGSL